MTPRGRRTRGAVGASRIAAGYLRRSTDRQEQSIPDQRKAIERYAEEQGIPVERWYVDDAISGTKASNRPGFMQMIADAQSDPAPFGFVLVYDVKRFGRLDNDEAGYYRHLLRARGVEVLYVSEGFGGPGAGSDTDDLLRPVKQWQARQESKDLSKVTIRGLLSRVEGGWWMGGAPSHGYDLRYESDREEFLFTLRFMPDASKQVIDENGALLRELARGESISVSRRDRARLVPGCPQRIETVRSIYRMYTEEGRGLTAISSALNRDGVPTPRSPEWSRIYSGRWSDGTVRAILVNPVYRGDLAWNRRADGRFHRISEGRAVERREVHGARLTPNDPNDWIVIRDAHEAIVSRRVWDLAKQIREGRPASLGQQGSPKRPVGGWSGARSRFVLSGLITCARCGGRYQGVTRRKGKPRNDGSVVKTFSYACGGYIARGRSVCEFGAIEHERLESLVIEAVLGHYAGYEGEDGRSRLAAAVGEALGVEAKDLAEAMNRAAAERARVDETIANLLDNITASTRDLIEERLAQLRHERDRLASRIEELGRLAAEQAEARAMIHETAKFLSGLKFILREGLPDERKAALRQSVHGITLDRAGGHAEIEVNPLPGSGLNGSGSTGAAFKRISVSLPPAARSTTSPREA